MSKEGYSSLALALATIAVGVLQEMYPLIPYAIGWSIIAVLGTGALVLCVMGIRKKERGTHANPMLKKALNVFFNKSNPFCYNFTTHDDAITHEQFFRLGLTNPNTSPAKEVEVILTRLTKENPKGQTTEMPVAPARLSPLGLSDKKGLFEITTDARYINIAYMHGDFDTMVTIPLAEHAPGNDYTILLPLPQERYRVDLLIRSSNIKDARYTVYLERPDKYWNLDVKIDGK